MGWTRGQAIGHGSSATVYVATDSGSGELFAVKSVELSCSKFLQKEQGILSQLSCPQIVKYMGFDVKNENNRVMYNLLMEYVPGGTLLEAVRRCGGSLDESLIKLYTRQILLGLEYLHGKGLVHCDIKSQNILIGQDGAMIADLGSARALEEHIAPNVGAVSHIISGTPAFMAPEVARGEEQEFPADIWALGCTVIEMATGSAPWSEADEPLSILYRIAFSGDVPDLPAGLSENAMDFLRRCLQRNPKERWTARQLLEHPFCNVELNFHQGEVAGKFTWNSPTTVLDQGLWDSLEPSESPQDRTRIGSGSSFPVERIRRLNDGALASGSKLPNWGLDEGWVTVRSNCFEEIQSPLGQNSSPASEIESSSSTMASPSALNDHAEEPERAALEEDFLSRSSSSNFTNFDSYECLEDVLVFSCCQNSHRYNAALILSFAQIFSYLLALILSPETVSFLIDLDIVNLFLAKKVATGGRVCGRHKLRSDPRFSSNQVKVFPASILNLP